MSLEGPKPCHFWDATTNSWRPARTGEAGELVWNSTTCSWEPGAIGGNWKWNTTTRSWAPGPGGTHIWNGTTWAPNEDEGYGGSHYWNGTAWLPNRGLSFGVLAISGLQALYDPSDLTSLYQSRTGGSTGAVDSVVGIMLDKSEMGGRTAAAFIAGQTELAVNGGFAADTDWTKGAGWTIAGGVGVATAASSDLSQASILTVGNWYWIQYTVSDYSAGTLTPKAGSGASGTAVSANGTYTAVLRAATTTSLIFTASGLTANIDNVSVKLLSGYHALAPSDAARPILRSASSKNYLDADGTDDWMQIFPTLNLGEQWWHVGGWQSDTTGKRAFTRAATYRNGVISLSANAGWGTYNAADTTALLTGAPGVSTPHVLTVEGASSSAMSGRINGAAGASIDPYDLGASPGLALFTADNSAYANGLDGRFYGGAWGTGSISSSDRALLERYVAGLTGVTL